MLLESRFYFMLENVIGARNVNVKEKKTKGENKIGNFLSVQERKRRNIIYNNHIM